METPAPQRKSTSPRARANNRLSGTAGRSGAGAIVRPAISKRSGSLRSCISAAPYGGVRSVRQAGDQGDRPRGEKCQLCKQRSASQQDGLDAVFIGRALSQLLAPLKCHVGESLEFRDVSIHLAGFWKVWRKVRSLVVPGIVRARLWCMEPRWCDRPFPGWLADPDCVWFRRTDRAIECVDLHGDFGLLGLECASVELAAVEPLDASGLPPISGPALKLEFGAV